MTAVKNQLVVFDFDWSFADQDTDRYVFEVLAPELRKSLRAAKTTTQWTDNVAAHLVELHKLGKTREEIESALVGLPVHPAMIRGVQAVKAPTESFEFSTLKTDLLPQIFSHLDPLSLISCCLVSHSFKAAASAALLWLPFLSTWARGVPTHVILPSPTYQPLLDVAFPPENPPTHPKDLFRARILIDNIARLALRDWGRSTSSTVRMECVDTIVSLGLQVYDRIVVAMFCGAEDEPEDWLAMRELAKRLVPTMERALALEGWRKAGMGDEKISIDWVARSFAPFVYESELWMPEAVDLALKELANECVEKVEEGVPGGAASELGVSPAAVAGAIRETLEKRNFKVEEYDFPVTSCYLSTLLDRKATSTDEKKIIPPIMHAILTFLVSIRLQDKYQLNPELFKLSKVAATPRDLLEEMTRALWRSGSPRMGKKATISQRDYAVFALSLVSLFEPSTSTPIKVHVPLSKALLSCADGPFSSDLFLFQSHLLHFVGDPTQRSEILNEVAEIMRERKEPFVVGQDEVRRRGDLDLQFNVGDVCWLEKEDADGCVGIVVSWTASSKTRRQLSPMLERRLPTLSFANFSSQSLAMIAQPCFTPQLVSKGKSEPAKLVEANPSDLSRVKANDNWTTTLDELESGCSLGLYFRARDLESEFPKYVKTGISAQQFPED
ncbi:hypothetical protein P7C70_g555, partial [Phenoliferia sp. Uapishka_3]